MHKSPIIVTKNIVLQEALQAAIVLLAVLFSGCLTSKKLDKFVAGQYGNRIPAVSQRKHPDIKVAAAAPVSSGNISSSASKISHVLPLLLYWQLDYKNTCHLNQAIPVNKFTNTFLSEARRKISPKLNGRKLELSIEQLPHVFAIDDKAHMIWLIYAFGWDKVSIQPEDKDLIVDYKLLQNNAVVKTGRISVQDKENDKRLGMFQSWKSATSAYLAQYNHDISNMARTFVDELEKEL